MCEYFTWCINMHYSHAWYPWKSESIGSPGTGVMDGRKLTMKVLEMEISLLQQQQVFLTTKLSLSRSNQFLTYIWMFLCSWGQYVCSNAHVVRGHPTELRSLSSSLYTGPKDPWKHYAYPSQQVFHQLHHLACPQSFYSAFWTGTIVEIKESQLIKQGYS